MEVRVQRAGLQHSTSGLEVCGVRGHPTGVLLDGVGDLVMSGFRVQGLRSGVCGVFGSTIWGLYLAHILYIWDWRIAASEGLGVGFQGSGLLGLEHTSYAFCTMGFETCSPRLITSDTLCPRGYDSIVDITCHFTQAGPSVGKNKSSTFARSSRKRFREDVENVWPATPPSRFVPKTVWMNALLR